MKITRLSLLFMLLGGLFLSCGSDEDFHTATINITSPEGVLNLEPGQAITFSGTIEDVDGLSSLEVTSDVGISATESLSGTSHTFSYSGTAPAEGEYSISMTVTNSVGNISTAVRNIIVTEADPCASEDMTILVVTVPDGTPADAQIEVVGAFNGWPGELDANFVLFSRGDNVFCLPVSFDEGAEFKFRRDGDWGKVEKDAAGEEIGNRVFTADPGNEIVMTVEKWADI